MAIDSGQTTHALHGGSDRGFGLVMAAFFVLVGLWPLLGSGGIRPWSLAVAAAFFVLAIFRPAALAGTNRIWTRLGVALNAIVSPLALAVVFFLSVLPIAVIYRLLGKDPLRLKFSRTSHSYWIPREPPGPDPKTFTRQF